MQLVILPFFWNRYVVVVKSTIKETQSRLIAMHRFNDTLNHKMRQ